MRMTNMVFAVLIVWVSAVVLFVTYKAGWARSAEHEQESKETVVYVRTDPLNGCQYVSATRDGALTPRLDFNGNQVGCTKQENPK